MASSHLFSKTVSKLDKYALTWYLVLLGTIYIFIIWFPAHPELTRRAYGIFFALLPLSLPVLIFLLWSYSWMCYVRLKKYAATKYTVLEVRLPEEITQGIYSMELVLRALYQTGEVDTPIHTHFKGQTRPWFSLELASHEGNVRFYIWTRTAYKDLVESQLYAHYPTVQVHEVQDYTLSIPFDLDKYDYWGVEQKLQKPDPYPITTYVEMGLDKPDLKDEFKNDPMNSIIEFFGSMKKGEHAWMQVIFRGHKGDGYDGWKAPRSKMYTGKNLTIDEWAKVEIDNIADKTKDENGKINFMRLTKGEQADIAAIQEKLEKQDFDVCIRMSYICEKNYCNNTRKAGFPSAMRSFEHGSEGRGLNGLAPMFIIGPFDYPWQDFRNIRRNILKERMYHDYVLRQSFFSPFRWHPYIVLNSEEVATIYHFPGRVSVTPTLERMLSKRANAPSNLPT